MTTQEIDFKYKLERRQILLWTCRDRKETRNDIAGQAVRKKLAARCGKSRA